MELRKLRLGIAGATTFAVLVGVACGDDDDGDATPSAPASYQAVLDKFGQVAPFITIRNAENAHVDA